MRHKFSQLCSLLCCETEEEVEEVGQIDTQTTN